MILAGVDIETTGLNEPEHRIIEVYVGLWNSDDHSLIRSCESRINPHRSIAPDAQRVHGIAITDLARMPPWESVADQFRTIIEEADLIVAHNGDEFDIPFINRELQRIGKPKLTKPSFDTMLQGRWATAIGNVPNLGALRFACGIDYDPSKAHAASYDVERMMECFFRGSEWGWFNSDRKAA